MKSFYIKVGDQCKGPYTLRQLREMWKKGVVNEKTTYCQEGGDQWRSLALMQSVLEQPSETNPQDSEAHCPSRTVFYYVLGIGLLIAVMVLLRSLAK